MKIKTVGRTDIDNYMENSGYADLRELKHYPILLFLESNDGIEVVIVNKFKDLMGYPSDSKVMFQWGGQWRSDFMTCTCGELLNEWLEAKKE